MPNWQSAFETLIARTSTDLPADVENAIRQAHDAEDPESNARAALGVILENTALARKLRRPICQDTGTVMLWVDAPASCRQEPVRDAFEQAVVQSTAAGMLRQNCVDSLTGKNSGNNLGVGHPVIHWNEADTDHLRARLILKGGGCENVGVQYALPDFRLGAGRDLDGVRRCVLEAIYQAQGKGCAPGVLAVVVGGDRGTGYTAGKSLLMRKIGQRNRIPELARLETRLLDESRALGIGPMGFGGQTTLLDVFIECRHRLPASYFVSVSYMCWAYRRRGFKATLDGQVLEWLF